MFYKPREIFRSILRYLDLPEIVVIHGARQVGKTTLMKMVIDYLQKKINQNVLFFDLEKREHLDLCQNGMENIIRYINAKNVDSNDEKTDKMKYIFIDEIQYLDDPSNLLKLFYDNYKGKYKLVVSGSLSFSIKSKFRDSLVGRIIDIELYGLSFKKFLDFKGLSYALLSNSELANTELTQLYKEYIQYGFYPQIVLTNEIDIKETYLNGIIEKYIYKDIKDLANIRNIDKFNKLILFLAAQVGQTLNTSELSSTLRISRPTIEEYISILNNTYIINSIRPFYRNVRSELTKMPKIYFEDLGILNVLRNRKLKSEIDGALFENSIYSYLRRIFKIRDIHFWRTTSKQEVDFIVDSNSLKAVEVKLYSNNSRIKNLNSFYKQYADSELYCVSLDKSSTGNKAVKYLYPWELERLSNVL